MTLAYWCVLAAALLPYVWISVAKFTGRRDGLRYNNRAPRAYLDNVQGLQQRAHWAHLNDFEAFAPFAAAVIIATQAGADTLMVNTLAAAFVVCRVLYGLCYLADLQWQRSAVWTVGFLCVIGLFVVAV
jgi:uncharacterized MAPEG superfamily protein